MARRCVFIKKPRTRGDYSPARELQNTNPQWVVAPVEKKNIHNHFVFVYSASSISVNISKLDTCSYEPLILTNPDTVTSQGIDLSS